MTSCANSMPILAMNCRCPKEAPPAPANDDVCNAAFMNVPGTIEYNNTGATAQHEEVNPGEGANQHHIWWLQFAGWMVPRGPHL
jgi:hypothetical protein